MTRRTLALVLLIVLFTLALTVAAAAQEAELRASSGPIQVIAKQPRQLSGSLGMTAGGRQGYEATLGGAVVKDRLFFFASAQHDEGWQFTAPAYRPSDEAFRFDGKLTAQLGDRNIVSATAGTLPSSFLNLRFDSVVSDNAFFSVNISQRSSSHDRSIP